MQEPAASPEPVIRDATPADLGAILRLNEEFVHFLSPLTAARLGQLHERSAYHRVACWNGAIAGFLLAFREGVDYDSPNYRWFAARHPRFLYIDRVVVAGGAQGNGIGSRLYADLIAFARRCGCERVTCEFDVDPPNPASERFHHALGFREVGRQQVGPSAKTVSLQALPLHTAAGEAT